jgi:plasmid stabilization system protein ParE
VKDYEWSEPALTAFSEFLDFLDDRSFALADRAEAEIKKTLRRLAEHPGHGHLSRWPGLLEWSAADWKKIIVYRETPDGLRIIAFYDARQDLSVVHPTPND